MKPLDPNYFETALAPLLVETPIGDARKFVDAINTDLKRVKRLGQSFGDGKQLLEAILGVEAGTLLGFTHITLAPKGQRGFDFTLRRNDEVKRFDVTEATDRLRNRVVEYDGDAGNDPSHEQHAEIAYQQGLFAKVVRRCLREKERDPEKNLIVYVNTGWLPEDSEIEMRLAQWHAEFKGRWASVYILFGLSGLVQIGPELKDIVEWREPPRGDAADSDALFEELFGNKG